ncbi:MAG: hypothetical protein QGG01_13190, partial [Roseibacillus sp.]|nr:hypothetical protein [Roseibacillus sp.]
WDFKVDQKKVRSAAAEALVFHGPNGVLNVGSEYWEAIRARGGPNNKNHDVVIQDGDGELALLERATSKPCKGHRNGLVLFYSRVKQCTSDGLRRKLEARLEPGSTLEPCVHICVAPDCNSTCTVDGKKTTCAGHYRASAVVDSVDEDTSTEGDGNPKGFQLEDHVTEGKVCVFARVYTRYFAGMRACGACCGNGKRQCTGWGKFCCRCRRRRQTRPNQPVTSEPEKECDPDSDAESIHEGEGYCQMMRVVIAGRGPIVQSKGGQCGCTATGLVGILNEDVLVSDCAGMEDEAGTVWVPGCDRHRAEYARRAVNGCASEGSTYLHSQVVNGVKLCPWCAAKRKGPQHAMKPPVKQLQKDLPPKETPVQKDP